MRRVAWLLGALAACGTPSAPGVDGSIPEQDAGPASDAETADAGMPACATFPLEGEGSIAIEVALANFERDLLRLEAVSLGPVGSICVGRRPPAVETIAIVELAVGAIYELRFTAEGYLPYTFRLELTPELVPAAGSAFFGDGPIVMVRGTELGPVVPSFLPLHPFREPTWGTRPGTDDLFYLLGDTWRVARPSASGRTIETIDVAAPTDAALDHWPTFTPDGEIVLLATSPPSSSAYSCVAVRAATGEILARDLGPDLCAVGRAAKYAAAARVGTFADDDSGERVVFEWDATGIRERTRLPYSLLTLGDLDATGEHVLCEGSRGEPIIREIASGAEAMPPREPDDVSRADSYRVLGADGTFTVHVIAGSYDSRAGHDCGTGGCSITVEPVGGALRTVVADAVAWSMSRRVPALVYVSASGELRHHAIATSADTPVAVDPFDPVRTFAWGEAFVVTGDAGIQVVDVATGEVRVTVPGTFTLEPDARDSAGVGGAATMLLRECLDVDCAAWVLDLVAMTATPSHDHPFRRGARAWFADPAGSLGAGPSSQATGRYVFFGGAGSTMEDVAATPAGAALPCAPFRWRSEWICAE